MEARSAPPPARYERGQRLWLRGTDDELPRLYVVTDPRSPSPRADRVVWGVAFEGNNWRSVDDDGHLANVEVQHPDPVRLLGWRRITTGAGSGPTREWRGRMSDGRHLNVSRDGDRWAFSVFDAGVAEPLHSGGPFRTVQQARRAAADWALAHPAGETA